MAEILILVALIYAWIWERRWAKTSEDMSRVRDTTNWAWWNIQHQLIEERAMRRSYE